ncbi:serine hydrolase [Leptolyngbya sp. FACHB-671]|uniref:serine hydrolase n=1 Tax=Leptolyngbya sp. FACHB-671 TaxID=2692812 RepID=UPI001F54BF9E|nr:serine hydrolase [Leptolyngbya sp. FACHB-671]
MLESDGQSERSRRRRLPPQQMTQPSQLIPLRRSEQGQGNSGDAAKGGSRPVRPVLARPERLTRTQRSARHAFNPNTSPPTDTRFNVRHLLFGNTSRLPAANARKELPPRLQSRITDGRLTDQPIRTSLAFQPTPRVSRAAVRLEPVRRTPPTIGRHRALVRPVRPDSRLARREATPLKVGRVRSRRQRNLSLSAQTERRIERRPARPTSPLVYIVRLLIVGVGFGAIAGTFLAIWNPTAQQTASNPQTTAGLGLPSQMEQTAATSLSRDATPTSLEASPTALTPAQEMTALGNTLKTLAARQPELNPGVFLFDLDTRAYLDLNGTTTMPSASIIKVPVLVALLQEVDAGNIRLDEMLTLEASDIAEGSGDMQYQPPGTQYSVLETATKMIIISDNSATNMLINRLGGISSLNQRFQGWGLTATAIRNPLPDLDGENTTSPEDMAKLLAAVTQGDLLSLRSRDRLLEIMRRTETNTLLPQGLGAGAIIAHKTGDIGSLVGDVGVIDMPNGRRYIAAVMVRRPTNDERAQELIREVSRATYEYLNQASASANEARRQ